MHLMCLISVRKEFHLQSKEAVGSATAGACSILVEDPKLVEATLGRGLGFVQNIDPHRHDYVAKFVTVVLVKTQFS